MDNQVFDIIRVKIIGAGGIGQCLLPTLCRLLNFGSALHSFKNAEVAIIDGDEFEENNRPRQAFKNWGNKAEQTIADLSEEFPDLMFRCHPTYLRAENIGMILREKDIVFCCVDNHNTRKLVSEHCAGLEEVTLISGGNNLDDGSVMVFCRREGEDLTLPLHAETTPAGAKYHPEIAHPNDKHPDEEEEREGCLEEQQAAPQLLVANNMAAALMLNAFHGLLEGVFTDSRNSLFRYDEAHFHLKSNKVRAITH